MSDFYQALDAPHFDYNMQPVDGVDGYTFRGPIPDLSKPYIACIGGAQTMGRFVQRPFGAQLADELNLPCLNLGLGGAGPRFALESGVLGLLQRASICVVQMFSGRSSSNALFDNSRGGRNYGRRVARADWVSFEEFFTDLMARGDQALLERTVRESRDDYAFYSMALGQALGVPSVLLWFSQRQPEYTPNWTKQFSILNHYPQLIDAATVAAIRPAFSAYVECADDSGLPQPLWRGAPVDGTRSDEHGQLWNHYYPSPEMHVQAASSLLPVCRQLLGRAPLQRPQ